MMRDGYVRAVEVVRVIDGDTFVCDVDLGFYVRARMSCRLAGINAPEHDEPGGPEARAALAELLRRGFVTVASIGVDKFAGRFDAQVIVTGPLRPDRTFPAWDVGATLVEQGLAVTWDGKGRKPVVPWPPPTAQEV
jgi:endonuclease YncB( thermonuclease family)